MLFLQRLAGHPVVLGFRGLVFRTFVSRAVESKGHPVMYTQRVRKKKDRKCQEPWVLGKIVVFCAKHVCTFLHSFTFIEFNVLRVRII